MTRRLFLGAATLGLLLLMAAPAQASLISWGFQTSSTSGPLNSVSGPGYVDLLTSTSIDPSVVPVVGDSGIVLANLFTNSTNPFNSPDKFSAAGADYSIALTLYDNPSDPLNSNSSTVYIDGKLKGTWSEMNSLIGNTFTSPATQNVSVGNLIFTISTYSYTPPGPPNATWYGSIGAVVSVSSRPNTQETPEPTSLALAGVGLSAAGISAWRRRRAAR